MSPSFFPAPLAARRAPGRHHVVAGVDRLDVRMGLQHRGERGLGLVRQPVGGLLGDDLDLRIGLDAGLEAVEPLDRRSRARQPLEHRDLAALRKELVGDVFAGLLGDLEIVAADEGRESLPGSPIVLRSSSMTGISAFIARATTGVSGAASNGEMRMRSTFWVMKLSICEVWVFTLPAPSAI